MSYTIVKVEVNTKDWDEQSPDGVPNALCMVGTFKTIRDATKTKFVGTPKKKGYHFWYQDFRVETDRVHDFCIMIDWTTDMQALILGEG